MNKKSFVVNRFCVLGFFSLLVGVTGCSSMKSADIPAPASAAPEAAPSGVVVLEPKMLSSIGIADVEETSLSSLLLASGKVQFNEDRTANISPPVPGQVQDLRFKVGD